jgi:hypothetical protein
MLHLFAGLDLHTGLLLLLALAFVLFYEAINGFHDTANAVATVIYTRAMRSQLAVVMAAVFNFLGVLLGGLSVAYAIVHMLPTDLLLNMGSSHGLAMVFSMLLAAIIWNLGTWYFGLPASSSHTLIGAIIGIGLTNALMTGTSVVDALNIPKVPGTQVPDNRRQQHREHHGKAMRRSHIKQQIRRQHMHNGIGNTQTTQQNTQKVEHRRHNHGELRTHRAGIDNGCHGVGCVMETIDGFVEQHKSQCKQ